MQKQNCAWPLVYNIVKRCYLLCTVMLSFSTAWSQFTVRIEIKNLPAAHKDEPVFAAGNFNEWNPGNNNYQFSLRDDKYFLEIKGLTAGAYKFKCTRGSWDKVECTAGGTDISDRSFKLAADTLLSLSIEGWKDDLAPVSNPHTASAHVLVMDTAFKMPQLNRHRRIWLYLPEGYKANGRRYPVLYMQDGQNIFDAYTSGYGEWGVDECLDSLIAKGKPGCIVVAVDNDGEKRMNEYNPYEFTLSDSTSSQTFAPEGNEYIDFLVQTLKPYIDKHYRTLPAAQNTGIAGSSMGALISYYAMLKYPSVFGKAGIFSPAFWVAEGLNDTTDSLVSKLDAKFFFYMGETEGKKHIDNMTGIQEKIAKRSSSVIYCVIDPEGRHNEAAWRKWFAAFYIWMMADGTNVPGGLNP